MRGSVRVTQDGDWGFLHSSGTFTPHPEVHRPVLLKASKPDPGKSEEARGARAHPLCWLLGDIPPDRSWGRGAEETILRRNSLTHPRWAAWRQHWHHYSLEDSPLSLGPQLHKLQIAKGDILFPSLWESAGAPTMGNSWPRGNGRSSALQPAC